MITVTQNASIGELQQAKQALEQGRRVHLSGPGLCLYLVGKTLHCDIIDPDAGFHRCENEYKVQIENAQRALANSPLTPLLPAARKWRVVNQGGADAIGLWPVP